MNIPAFYKANLKCFLFFFFTFNYSTPPLVHSSTTMKFIHRQMTKLMLYNRSPVNSCGTKNNTLFNVLTNCTIPDRCVGIKFTKQGWQASSLINTNVLNKLENSKTRMQNYGLQIIICYLFSYVLKYVKLYMPKGVFLPVTVFHNFFLTVHCLNSTHKSHKLPGVSR